MTLAERAQALADIYRELDLTRHNDATTVYRMVRMAQEARTIVEAWPDNAWPNFPRSQQGPELTKQWVLDGLSEGIAEAKGYRYTQSDTSWMDVLRPIHGVLEIFYRRPR